MHSIPAISGLGLGVLILESIRLGGVEGGEFVLLGFPHGNDRVLGWDLYHLVIWTLSVCTGGWNSITHIK